MKLFSDHDPRFRLLGLKVALFVIATLIGVLLIMGALGMARGVFVKKTPFFFIAGNALEIKPGMAVMLSGFKIGTVDDLSLRNDAAVRVDVLIDNRYTDWMRQGTRIEVRKQGFIGEAYLNVRPSTSVGLLPQDGKGELGYITTKGIEEIAADLESKIDPVLKDVHAVVQDAHQLMVYLNDEKGDAKRTLSNLEKTTAQAQQTLKTLDTTLQQSQHTMTSVQKTVETANTKLSAVDVEGLQTQANTTLLRLNRSLEDVNTMTGALKQPVVQVAPKIPAFVDDTQTLVRQGQQTLRQSDRVVRDVEIILDRARQNWPLNLWAPTPTITIIPQDSHD